MNSTVEFLDRLKNLGVVLTADGDRLRCSAPKNTLTSEIREELTRQKAEILRLLAAAPTGVQGLSLARIDRGGPLPLSFAQERMWFLQQLASESSAYTIAPAVRVAGSLDRDILGRVWNELVRRHESLRTTFHVSGDGLTQVIAAPCPADITWIDMGHLPANERVEAALDRALQEAERPFDLATGPLYRVAVLQLGPADHIVVLALHHIISDQWSVGVLTEEWTALYAAFAKGEPSPLAEPVLQYADFAAWQRRAIDEPATQDQLAYWRHQLADLIPLELPADRVRPASATFAGARGSLLLPADLMQRLRDLAQAERATLFMVLLSGLKVVLTKYCGTTDVAVGTPVAGRTQVAVERMVGVFVNTLVLRSDLSGDPTFRQLLSRVRDACLGAFANQELPFDRLVSELRPNRDAAQAPFFQVLFGVHNTARKVDLHSLGIEPVVLPRTTTPVDLSIAVETEVEGRLTFSYNSELFDKRTIERMLRHYVSVLECVVQAPQRQLSAISLMPASERTQMLEEWNPARTEYPEHLGVAQLFEAQADRTPARTAVIQGEDRVTYAQLRVRMNQIAARLTALGVGPDVLVGIGLARTPEMIATLLAVSKVGGAYVPMDPAFPAQRLAWMLEDARPAVLVTERALEGSWPEHDAEVLLVDDVAADAPQLMVPALTVDPGAAAYVIFTSGSTGRPKGVEIPRRAMTNFLTSMQREPGIGENDVLVAVTTLSFDIAVLELFLPLVSGAAVVVATRDEAIDAARLQTLLAAHDATIMQATPATWRLLIEAGWQGTPGLRVLCGGEPLPADLAAALLARAGEVWNLYGPTETTVWSTLSQVRAGEPITVGRPIANTQVYVLGPDRDLLPAGVAGELWIGGDGVARGYLGRPDLTAERFVPDPFVPGGVMYRTGDLARWTADGVLDHLGRVDHQVKVRGFRIELEDIETTLVRHASIRQAVVVPHAAGHGDVRLVAFLRLHDAETLDDAAVRSHLRETLPDYMIPAVLTTLDDLPMTANGKVDRKSLMAVTARVVTDVGATATAGELALADPLEETLAKFWQELLHVRYVTPRDNFFELGGHSLLATRLLGRVRERLGVDLPMRTLFNTRSLRELADAIRAIQPSPPQHLPEVRPAVHRGEAFPLSYAQRRLWFFEQVTPGTSVLHVYLGLRLRGTPDVAALEHAFAEIARRHEALRTVFRAKDVDPVQVVLPPAPFELPVHDLRGGDAGELERLAADVAHRPFSLTEGPLWRAALIRTRDDESLLCVTVHHLVFDGSSAAVFIGELSVIYGATVSQTTPALPEMSWQYGDFCEWERSVLDTAHGEPDLAYWRSQLAAPLPVLELPTDHSRPDLQTYRGAKALMSLPKAPVKALQAIAREQNASLFMVLLAAFKGLLFRITGQTDLIVGSPVAGRTRPELDSLIGLFINTVAIRTDASGDPSFADLVRRVRTSALDAYQHQAVPFDRIVAAVQPGRGLSRSPIFQVMFNLQDAGDSRVFPIGDLEATLESRLDADSKFDLTVYATTYGDGVDFSFVYNADLFSAERIAYLLEEYGSLLQSVAENPEQPLSRLSLLTSEATRVIPDPAIPLSRRDGVSLVSRLRAHARSTPDAIAVTDAAGSWTYDELDRHSDGVALQLQELGVGDGEVVAVFAQRSLSLVTAIMGILKAGGAFCILDPSYPVDRLIACLERATPRVWLRLDDAPAEDACLAEYVAVNCAATLTVGAADAMPVERTVLRELPDDPDRLTYVAFTSGSTGGVKAVAGTERPLRHFVDWHCRQFDITNRDTVSMLSGLAHDPLLRDILTPLWVGARLAIPAPEELREPAHLAAFMLRDKVTISHLTPPLATMLASAAGSVDGQCDALRRVFFAGDRLTPQTVSAMRTLAPNVKCVNYYGATETPQGIAYWEVPDAVAKIEGVQHADAAAALPIGSGIEGVQLLVLTTAGRLAGIGEVGEICVRTPYLSRGYLGEPGLTEQRFVPNPFRQDPADLMYRTGDLGRYTPSGAVQFVGRADNQVKLRGFRIELGEIEAALLGNAAVAQAVAMVLQGSTQEPRLVAYITATDGATVDPSRERESLKRRLPHYMCPAEILVLPSMPLTPNGKIDRGALPSVDTANVSRSLPHDAAPRDAVERELATIWREVLGQPHIGIYDDFFDLGGHSLTALQLVMRLRANFGVQLNIATLFQARTIAELAALVRKPKATEWRSVVAIRAEGTKTPFYCVHGVGGEVLAFSEIAAAMDPDRPFYGLHAPGFVEGQEPLDSVEAMAAVYVKDLREAQPEGPYLIGGYSLGARVALEMAQLLRQQGAEVAFVGAFDTAPSANVHYGRLWLFRFFENLPRWLLHDLLSTGRRENIARVKRYLRAIRKRARGLMPSTDEAADRSRVDDIMELGQMKDTVRRIYALSYLAGFKYRPKPYDGAVTVFRAEVQRLLGAQERDLGWSRIAASVDVRPVPGNHANIIKGTNAVHFARALSEALDQASPSHRPVAGESASPGESIGVRVRSHAVQSHAV